MYSKQYLFFMYRQYIKITKPFLANSSHNMCELFSKMSQVCRAKKFYSLDQKQNAHWVNLCNYRSLEEICASFSHHYQKTFFNCRINIWYVQYLQIFVHSKLYSLFNPGLNSFFSVCCILNPAGIVITETFLARQLKLREGLGEVLPSMHGSKSNTNVSYLQGLFLIGQPF
jgi:hypothetical protein